MVFLIRFDKYLWHKKPVTYMYYYLCYVGTVGICQIVKQCGFYNDILQMCDEKIVEMCEHLPQETAKM